MWFDFAAIRIILNALFSIIPDQVRVGPPDKMVGYGYRVWSSWAGQSNKRVGYGYYHRPLRAGPTHIIYPYIYIHLFIVFFK